FLSHEESIQLEIPAGGHAEATLSIDSEIGWRAVATLALKDPKTLEIINRTLKPVSVSSLAAVFKQTEAQIRAFAIKKGVQKGQAEYEVADLNPAYAGYILKDAYGNLTQERLRENFDPMIVSPMFGNSFAEILHAKGLAFDWHFDSSTIEVNYSKWE